MSFVEASEPVGCDSSSSAVQIQVFSYRWLGSLFELRQAGTPDPTVCRSRPQGCFELGPEVQASWRASCSSRAQARLFLSQSSEETLDGFRGSLLKGSSRRFQCLASHWDGRILSRAVGCMLLAKTIFVQVRDNKGEMATEADCTFSSLGARICQR